MQDQTIDRIANVVGIIGRILVVVGMGCACYLFWHLIVTQIIMKGI